MTKYGQRWPWKSFGDFSTSLTARWPVSKISSIVPNSGELSISSTPLDFPAQYQLRQVYTHWLRKAGVDPPSEAFNLHDVLEWLPVGETTYREMLDSVLEGARQDASDVIEYLALLKSLIDLERHADMKESIELLESMLGPCEEVGDLEPFNKKVGHFREKVKEKRQIHRLVVQGDLPIWRTNVPKSESRERKRKGKRRMRKRPFYQTTNTLPTGVKLLKLRIKG